MCVCTPINLPILSFFLYVIWRNCSMAVGLIRFCLKSYLAPLLMYHSQSQCGGTLRFVQLWFLIFIFVGSHVSFSLDLLVLKKIVLIILVFNWLNWNGFSWSNQKNGFLWIILGAIHWIAPPHNYLNLYLKLSIILVRLSQNGTCGC